ncbi:MAG: ABC transporter ATP-binding protein [Microbacteriaceae bacterium]
MHALEPEDDATEAAPAVEILEVSVRAPGRSTPLLDDVSVRLSVGERMIVLGPSGSGKSSLLHVVTGVIPHSQNLDCVGGVQIDAVDATSRSVIERARRIGVVAQDPSASLCLARVDQEVALPLENHGVPPQHIAARVDEALARADASRLVTRATSELSGGEVQRVALAAALAANPEILLLDEPTSMLDPAGVRAVRSAVDAVIAERQCAVVLVEHRLDEYAGVDGARGLPERALVLDEMGRVVADGSTERVLLENAATLHDAGCWLPMQAELLAITGHANGLGSPSVREWLADAATERDGDDTAPATRDDRALLRARSLIVGHRVQGARRRDRDFVPIVHAVDMTLRAGEIVALVGANGAGKSSLLLTLAGLLPPGSGTVEGPRAGMVFQNPEHQFLAHRVRDEIAVGVSGSGIDVARVVERQLRNHRLEHVADRDPHRLSGGEKRRLSLAAMLAHDDRPVLLADEPAFGLDRRDTVATAQAFRREARHGRAVLFSSHDLRFVATVADRVVVLAEGRVAADAPVDVVLRDTAVLRAAGLELPPLVAWLLAEYSSDLGAGSAQRVLRRLYSAASHGALRVPFEVA